MTSTDYTLAKMYENSHPHTFIAVQHLVMAMEKVVKFRGKKSFLGRDKGLSAMNKFEKKLKDALLALVLDEKIKRNANPYEFCEALLSEIKVFSVIFPNWQNAYSYASEYFEQSQDVAVDRITSLLR